MPKADKVLCKAEVIINSQGAYRLEALVTLAEQGKEALPQHRLMAMHIGGLLQVFQSSSRDHLRHMPGIRGVDLGRDRCARLRSAEVRT